MRWHFRYPAIRQLSGARLNWLQIIVTHVRARTTNRLGSLRIIRGVTRHKNIPTEYNVTIWNFYDSGFFPIRLNAKLETRSAQETIYYHDVATKNEKNEIRFFFDYIKLEILAAVIHCDVLFKMIPWLYDGLWNKRWIVPDQIMNRQTYILKIAQPDS